MPNKNNPSALSSTTEEVKKLLDDYFQSALSPEEDGEIYINVASEYMKMINAINQQYLNALSAASEVMKQIRVKEREMPDKIDAAFIRNQIFSEAKGAKKE